MNVSYRKAGLVKDAAKLSRMYKKYTCELSQYSERISELTDEDIKRDAVDYLENDDYQVYFITSGQVTLGFFILGQNGNKHPNTDSFMAEFYVDVKYRRKGVGKYIAQKVLCKYGVKWSFFILMENHSALEFWQAVVRDIGEFMHLEEIGATPEDCFQYGVEIKI